MDNDLKQRLAGAAVVIGLAVVVLPFVLDGDGFNAGKQSSPTPAEQGENWQKITLGPDGVIPADTDATAEPEAPVASAPSVEPQTPTASTQLVASDAPERPNIQPLPAQETRQPPPEAEVAVAPPPSARPSPPPPPPPKEPSRSGWAVQVGSFGVEQNASRLRQRLSDAGFDAYVSTSTSGGKTRHRVRVGPYENQSKARQISKEVTAVTGLKTALMKEQG